MLELQNVSYRYGKTKALDGLSCRFENGVYGLLGPNGSGKTTLMNLLTDNLRTDCGKILWNNTDIRTLGAHYRASIGYAPQYCELYPSMRAIDFLRYMAVVKACDTKETARETETMLKYFMLDDAGDKKIGTFSGGMKQRLLFIQAFLGDPALVLLDEPTAGLDPLQRALVKQFIRNRAKDKIILYATHILHDLQDVGATVLFLKQGRLICTETTDTCLEDRYLRLYGNDEADPV